MVVGQQAKKWTFLLDNVEVKGTVLHGNETLVEKDLNPKTGKVIEHPKGEALNTSDSFNLIPDDNYKHLVSNTRGSMGVIHCECYSKGLTDDPNRNNHPTSWSLRNSSIQKF